MKQLQKYILLALLAGAVLAGCRDDEDAEECPVLCDDPSNPECPNYNPCLEESPITAEFKIYDDVYSAGPNANQWFEDDNIYRGRIKFEAMEDSANYTWYLGQETLNGSEFKEVIKTTEDLSPGTYTAALVVEKGPNAFCFPNDAGRDSVFKTFDIVGVCDLMIMNKFKGVFDSAPNDSVIVEFLPIKLLPGNQDWEVACEDVGGTAYINLSGQNDTASVFFGDAVTNRYYTQSTNQPFWMNGYFEVNEDGTCQAAYEMYDEERVFNGKIYEE
jgi:hypothetical protein